MDLSKSKFKTSCFVFIVEKSCFEMIVSVLQGIIHLVRTQNFQKNPYLLPLIRADTWRIRGSEMLAFQKMLCTYQMDDCQWRILHL